MDLFRKGDFMHQADKNSCVAGSTQTMMNIIDSGRPNRSTAFQQRLYQRGRELSPNKAKLGPIGIDLTGWAELLNTNGYGPYVVDGAATRRGAIRKAAKALRLTDRPVGLVTWRGAHSWVMSGFTATADPAYSDDFKVTKVVHPGRLVPLCQHHLGCIEAARLARARGCAGGGLPALCPAARSLAQARRQVHADPAAAATSHGRALGGRSAGKPSAARRWQRAPPMREPAVHLRIAPLQQRQQRCSLGREAVPRLG